MVETTIVIKDVIESLRGKVVIDKISIRFYDKTEMSIFNPMSFESFVRHSVLNRFDKEIISSAENDRKLLSVVIEGRNVLSEERKVIITIYDNKKSVIEGVTDTIWLDLQRYLNSNGFDSFLNK